MPQRGVETLLSMSARIPLHPRVALRPLIAAHRQPDGGLGARDGLLLVPVRVLDTATARVTLTPGVNIPFGSIGEGTRFVPTSTGSVDPWLGADVIAGGAWLGGLSVGARTPLYAGVDGVRQGTFVRATARGARRIGDGGAAWVGVSPVLGTADDAGRQGFAEVAAVAGGVVPLTRTWALTPQVRVPVWQQGSAYSVAVGLGLSAVLSKDAPDAAGQ